MRKFHLFLYGFIFTVLTIAVFVIGCGGGGGGSDSGGGKRCTDSAYPLLCSDTGKCCARGAAYYCDGMCYSSGCPSGTIRRADCVAE